MRKKLFIVLILMLLHSAEESIFYFWQSVPAGLPILNVYILGQIALYGLLTYALFRPESKTPAIIIGLILLYEIVHVTTAFNLREYAPGLVTAVAILIFAVRYWMTLLPKLKPKTV